MSFEAEKNKILNNKRLWEEVEKINSIYVRCNFNSIQANEIIRYEKRTSKAKYGHSYLNGTWISGSTFDFKGFLAGKIFEEMPIYEKLMSKYLSIFQKYDEYEKRILKVFGERRLFADERTSPLDTRNWFARTFGKSTLERFLELKHYEEDILDKRTFSPRFPTVELHLTATTQYDDYARDVTYGFRNIVECYNMAEEKIGKMSFMQQQRAIVSDDMRYNVLKRDGFRCCLCGKTANDGVKLEVDHIIPVSKGGKSTYDNLQTLCERCNRGKRDKC